MSDKLELALALAHLTLGESPVGELPTVEPTKKKFVKPTVKTVKAEPTKVVKAATLTLKTEPVKESVKAKPAKESVKESANAKPAKAKPAKESVKAEPAKEPAKVEPVKESTTAVKAEPAKPSYTEIMTAIKEECKKIHLSYASKGDGRIVSALKETEYLELLQKGFKTNYPSMTFEIPKDRYWYDLRIESIPINLKITTGGTDNAFNKVAILYTLTGKEIETKNMNYNKFYKFYKDNPKKTVRDLLTEYHYLVVEKKTGDILLKSILDIHTYKTNPCNILQINWTNEFKECAYCTEDFVQKGKSLLSTAQTSLRQSMESMKDFLEAEL